MLPTRIAGVSVADDWPMGSRACAASGAAATTINAAMAAERTSETSDRRRIG
jgi:hypothetical protein